MPDPDLWQRIRKGFLLEPLETPLILEHEAWYSSRPDYIKRFVDRGSRYLHHIVEEVEKRGMPTEIALLPVVESAFNPQALSVAKASGMWQFVPSTGKDYALKVPHDPGCGDRLLAEAAVLRQLRHEHIVAVHEVITIAARPCLLLDHAGERTLADLLRAEGTLSLELARRYGDDLLSAVQYIEERSVTHRDIKPSNVGFTGYEGRQKHLLLLDFSLASAAPTAAPSSWSWSIWCWS